MTNPDLTGRRLGEYVLHEAIGQGGGGLVYKSRQTTLDRDVVVKVMRNRENQTSNAKERFLREAQLASRLKHHYATHIYGFGVEPDGTRWIAMELAPGITFDRWLREHGPMSLEKLVPFVERVAEVVHAAHKLDIIHRDIKPSNVMVVEDDAGILVPKLLDFGIAKAAYDAPLTRRADGSPGQNVPAPNVKPPAKRREIPPDHDEDEWSHEDYDYDEADRERERYRIEFELAEREGRAMDPAIAAAPRPPPSFGPRPDSPFAVEPPKPGYVTRTDPEAHKVGFTPPGAPMGSTPYMSPEQHGDASSVGPAADIYSLGVFVYQALFGELPPPAAPKLRAAANATALERIFARALAWAPADRQPTALVLASELRTALEASEREQLRASTKQWEIGDRAPGLLWGLDMLARFESWTRSTSWRPLDKPELEFIAHSHRRARRSRWGRRLVVGLAGMIVLITLGGLQLYTSATARLAREQVAKLEVEQGRQALHDNSAEAKVHLASAYRRGDHSNGTTFMLARALQSDRAQLARLPGRGGRMWSARFSPSGDTIVTTDDQSAQLWDAKSYQLRSTLPHADAVYDAVFGRDGKTLYTACGDGTIGVWDVSTGVSLQSLRNTGKPPRYYSLALSPDERTIAAIDINGAIATVWDLRSSAVLATVTNDGVGWPTIAFTTDGRWLATTGGNDVAILDTATWKKVQSIPKAMHLCVDPTGPRLATGSSDGDVTIWNLESGLALHRLRVGGHPIDQIAFSLDGKRLAVADGGQAQIWDAVNGQVQIDFFMHASQAMSLEFSSGSQLLVSAFHDGTAVLASSSTGVIRSIIDSSDGPLRYPHLARDEVRLIAAARNGAASVWNADTSYLRWRADPKGFACNYDIPFEQRFVSIACPDTPTRIWDAQEGRLVAELPSIVDLHDDWISVLSAVSSTGSRAAIVRGHDVGVYELPSARLLRTVHHVADVNVVAFTPDTQELLSADLAGAILLTREGQDSVALPRATAGIDALGITQGQILAASADRQLRIYDRATRGLVAQQVTATRIATLRFSSDGTRMATIPPQASGTAGSELWDLQRLQLIDTVREPRGPLYSVWFPGDAHELLTTSGERVVRKWNADTGRLVRTYRGNASLLMDATQTADGKTIVALGIDGTLWFWDGDTGSQLWSISALRSPGRRLRRYRGDLITIGAKGEISGWQLPEAEVVIKEVLDVAVSCGDETQPSDPKTCRLP